MSDLAPGTKEVEVEGANLKVLEVVHPGEDAGDEFAADQNAKLYEYRLTGVNRGYIDPSRDQEPDIAPEFGVSPHPDLFNPRAPKGDFGVGVNLDPERNPVVLPVEEKTKRAEEAQKRVDEATEAELDRSEGQGQFKAEGEDAPSEGEARDQAKESAEAARTVQPEDASPKRSQSEPRATS